MIELSERLRFAPESFQPLRVHGEEIGQDLEGDLTIELGIVRTIDLPHAAGTEQGRDPVDANLPAHERVFSRRPLLHPGGHLHRRRVQESLGGRGARQQRLYFHPEGVIARARVAQEDLALFFAACQRRVIDARDFLH